MGTLGEEAAQRLEALMAKLIATIEGLDEATVHHLPGEGEWSAIETLAHVAELVPFWAHRARQVAEGTLGDRPYGRNPDEYALRNAAVADHGSDSLPTIIAWLRSGGQEAAAILRAIPDRGWARSALYESEQPVRHTVSDLVEQRILSHVQAHTEQAARAARQARAARV
jgi:uncharacterized damage-inducible protein DinB